MTQKTDFNDVGDPERIRRQVDNPIQVPAAATTPTDADHFDVPAWPILAADALHGFAGEVVKAATRHSEADPAAVLATLLTHAGIVVGRGPYVRVGDDVHHARLFCCLVGQSARGRKGTSQAPIRRIWDRANRQLGPLNWKSGPMSTGEGLINSIRDGDDKEGGDPGVDDKRLLVVEGEFGAPLRAMQRQGNTLSTVLRSAWDGRTLEPLTKSALIRVSEPHVGIIGHITQQELNSLLGQVDIFNGFANRFLFFCVRRSKRVPLANGMPDAVVAKLGDEYTERLKKARVLGEVELDDEARALYERLYDDLTNDHEDVYGIVVARAEVQLIRLALCFAAIEASPLIAANHLQAAAEVWNYCDASAKYLFGKTGADPLCNRILEALASGPLTRTELHKALGNHTDTADLKTALANLLGRGRVDRIKEATGGRSREVWRLRAGFETANEAEKAKNGTAPELNSHNSLRSQANGLEKGTCHS